MAILGIDKGLINLADDHRRIASTEAKSCAGCDRRTHHPGLEQSSCVPKHFPSSSLGKKCRVEANRQHLSASLYAPCCIGAS